MSSPATITVATLFCLTLASPAAASDPDTAGIRRAFDKMKQGLQKQKEALFSTRWDPRGYAKNLVGGSGIAGKSVYRQGRKRWFFKPVMASIRALPRRRGAPWIVTCDIWSWRKNRAVDRVWVLMIYDRRGKKWLVLGSGERVAEVEALGARYVAKKPLAPKGKQAL